MSSSKRKHGLKVFRNRCSAECLEPQRRGIGGLEEITKWRASLFVLAYHILFGFNEEENLY
jgi:hypothetical protein